MSAGVDVTTDVVVDRPLAAVAAYTCDPRNAPEWYANIRSVDLLTPGPLAVGSRMRFVAGFLGRRLAYVYEVLDHVPDERLVMSTSQGPFPMTTTYTFTAVGEGQTLVTLRNHGEPAGFGSMAAPVLRRAVGRATRKDLAALKNLLESRAD